MKKIKIWIYILEENEMFEERKCAYFIRNLKGKGSFKHFLFIFWIPPLGLFLQGEKSLFSLFEAEFPNFTYNGTQISLPKIKFNFSSPVTCPSISWKKRQGFESELVCTLNSFVDSKESTFLKHWCGETFLTP